MTEPTVEERLAELPAQVDLTELVTALLPGDKLIFRTAERLSLQAENHARQFIAKALPGVDFLLIDPSVDVKVLRPSGSS